MPGLKMFSRSVQPVFMTGPSSNLHTHLRAWRKRSKLTLEQTANIIGSKANTISGWETGNRTVDLDNLGKLAAAYKVEPAALLYSPDDQEQAKDISEAGRMLSKMTQEQRVAWLELGRQLTSR
ncbi:hypothetical protein AA23498_3429 [Acetobacter nitrogenifigens DSM 23921 = NBRC 105050]|uniref:HTH cro/C1-type domain-containing protein n=1 Tax=Acetobacter nitrogenifigens DSM 23921 = NBRC 105050 TaxID=1120919 RepID=A0A511XEY2_9PROT|nr:helix-turn-helix transcriptional regulator [Acetobacter nitrogenifigens]GBQ99176.1 hypothetical protein AA23498_3429 [Acetobacter nitrogenifigens DSM 23921 = NBRC 105050]GEN61513.1 hypothetical protein ANI02nite_33970 [Acetobacter nitrogenifigens DSM 23921 = NBRC 105050]